MIDAFKAYSFPFSFLTIWILDLKHKLCNILCYPSSAGKKLKRENRRFAYILKLSFSKAISYVEGYLVYDSSMLKVTL
jgi:hypothetical protein